MYILSQILVVVADILFVVSMFTKKKSLVITFFFVSDIVFALHYLCFDNGITGAITVFIDSVYLIVIYLLEKYNKAKYNVVPTIVAIILTIITTIFTWHGAISLLPMFAMLIYFVGMIPTELIFVKSGALFRNICNIVYMLLLASYIGAGLEIGVAINTLVGLILSIKHYKKIKKLKIQN